MPEKEEDNLGPGLPEQICDGDYVCVSVLSLCGPVHHSLLSLVDVAPVELSVEQSHSHVEGNRDSLVIIIILDNIPNLSDILFSSTKYKSSGNITFTFLSLIF